MRIAAALLLLVPAGIATGFPVPKNLKPDENPDRAKLQGRWKLESVQAGGKPFRLAGGIHTTFEFRGDALTMVGKNGTTTGKFKLDAAGGLKRCVITGMLTTNADGTPGTPDNGLAYGYVLDGDKLTLASTLGNQKPADPAKPGENIVTYVLTRVTEKK